MNMYKVFLNTDYSILENNYKLSKEERNRLFWKSLMDLKSNNYNESDMSCNNKNRLC